MDTLYQLCDLFKTKTCNFFKSKDNVINFNQGCKHDLAYQTEESRRFLTENFDVCFGRGTSPSSSILEDLETKTKQIMCCKSMMNLDLKEWEVLYNFSNTTDAINNAIKIIYQGIDKQKNTKFYVNSLSHASLLSPILEIVKKNENAIVKVFDGSFLTAFHQLDNICKQKKASGYKRDLLLKYFENNKVILCTPYIDNLFGINHLKNIYENKVMYNYYSHSHSSVNVFHNNLDIILDAAQGAEDMFIPLNFFDGNYINSKDRQHSANAMLKYCSAITFGTHKFHGYHLGILLIKKEKLEMVKDYNEFSVGGGMIEDYSKFNKDKSVSKGSFYSDFTFDYSKEDIKGGTKPIIEFICFGAWLSYLCNVAPKQFVRSKIISTTDELGLKIKNYTKTTEKNNIQNRYNRIMNINRIISQLALENICIEYPEGVDKNRYKSKNCILTSEYISARDLYSKLLDNKIETRVGEFCNQLYFSTNIHKQFLRISTSIATSEKNVNDLCLALKKIDYEITTNRSV